MRRFVALAKIGLSESGVISTLGTSFGHYTGDTSGLINRTWYPILQPDLSLEIRAVLPWESGDPRDAFGTVRLVNGADGLSDYVLDRFITAQVGGLDTEIRRGYSDQAWDEMELWFRSRNGRVWFDGRKLLIEQRSRLDVLDQPLIDTVFEEGEGAPPNERLINQTTPLLIGPASQIAPKIWDANREVFYVARNQGVVELVREGGAITDNFNETNFGFQLTQGFGLAITADAIGPGIDPPIINTVVDWQFDSWTGDDPDGMFVIESPPDSEVTQDGTNDTALITVNNAPTANTGWIGFEPNPFEPFISQSFNQNYTATGASTVEQAIMLDDGSFARVDGLFRVAKFDISSIPDTDLITGYEIRIVLETFNPNTIRFSTLGFQTVEDPDTELQNFAIATFISSPAGQNVASDGEVAGSGLNKDPILDSKHTLTGGDPNFLATGIIGDAFGPAEELTGKDLKAIGMGFVASFENQAFPHGAPDFPADIYQVEAKVHHQAVVNNLLPRLFSETEVLTPGTRYELLIEYENADIVANWGGSETQGGALLNTADPFATEFAQLEGSGTQTFEFIPNGGFFGIEFRRFTTTGTTKIKRIRVRSKKFGLNLFSELVPYMAGLITDDDIIDQTSIDAHDAACGFPEVGAYITENESFSEVMSFFVRSLSGTWWRDRDAKVRSRLWVIDQTATPVLSLDAFDVDGILRQPKIDEGGEVRTSEAPEATERAVGAKNQNPLRIGETAGISEEFTPQELANVIEEWRVRRRANFDDLNPWPVAGFGALSLTSIIPTTGDEAGGTAVTITGENFDTGAAASVDFGTDPATNVVVVSSTEIICDSPAGTGTVDVTVTQGSKSDTLIAEFEYVELWTPADTPTAMWYKYSDSATITLDGSGNIEQTDDKSGNARHLKQTDAAKRFGVITQNGMDAADPDGSNDRMQTDSFATLSQPNTYYLAVKNGPNDGQVRILFDGLDTTNRNAFATLQGTDEFIQFAGGDLGGAVSGMADNWSVLVLIFDGSSSEVWVNGALELSGNAGAQGITGLTVGSRGSAENSFHNRPMGEIGVLNRRASTADRQKLEGYLAHGWGKFLGTNELVNALPSGHPYKSSPP